MIKRLITLFMVTAFVCAVTWANEEYTITLEKGNPKGQTIELPYGNISFSLVEYGSYNRVLVSIENTTTSQAILLFKNALDEKMLKKNKPKIEFEKTYPGSKGKRTVYGCKELNQPFVSIIPQEKLEIFGLDVYATSITELELPVYLAKYDPKKLVKKGTYNVNYKILSEDILNFNIGIKGWSESDSEYVAIRAAVEEYIRSVSTVTFCKNKKHIPSIDQQQKPYQEKKDSLVSVINSTFQDHPEWFSTDLPHIKYSELLAQLNKVNLNEHLYDCGEHKVAPKQHSCGYCSLSAQQIYHQLDDIYQQLRTGKLTKDVAVKKAQGLNLCYQKNNKRKKDSGYTDKISKFYSRIINY